MPGCRCTYNRSCDACTRDALAHCAPTPWQHALETVMCLHLCIHPHCRVNRWWEQSAFQLRLLAMLLVVVNGSPLGNYLQLLMLLCLLQFELLYQACLQPYRFPHNQIIHILLICVLGSSLIAALFLENFEGKASAGGLTTIAIGTAIGNVMFCICVFYFICTNFWPQAKTLCRSARNKVVMYVKPLQQRFKAFIGHP